MVKANAQSARDAVLPADDGADEADLWQRYKQRGDLAARDLLAARYGRYVRNQVTKRAAKLPAWIDQDLLTSAAQAGLLRAMEIYRPGELSFAGFAYKFLHGHMLDALRKHEPNGRRVTKVYQQRERIAQQLAVEGKRHHDAAVTAMLPESDREVPKHKRSQSLETVVSVSATNDRKLTLADLLAGEEGIDSPHDRDERIRTALRGLSFDEQVLIYLKYWKGATMKSIGHCFGLSESRISQQHAALIRRLAERGKDTLIDALL